MISVVFALALAALASAGLLFFLLEGLLARQRWLEERVERLEAVDLGGAPYRRSASALRDIAIPDPPMSIEEWNRRQRVRPTATPGPGAPRPS